MSLFAGTLNDARSAREENHGKDKKRGEYCNYDDRRCAFVCIMARNRCLTMIWTPALLVIMSYLCQLLVRIFLLTRCSAQIVVPIDVGTAR